jgi:hypothetical protein
MIDYGERRAEIEERQRVARIMEEQRLAELARLEQRRYEEMLESIKQQEEERRLRMERLKEKEEREEMLRKEKEEKEARAKENRKNRGGAVETHRSQCHQSRETMYFNTGMYFVLEFTGKAEQFTQCFIDKVQSIDWNGGGYANSLALHMKKVGKAMPIGDVKISNPFISNFSPSIGTSPSTFTSKSLSSSKSSFKSKNSEATLSTEKEDDKLTSAQFKTNRKFFLYDP